jgi:hypothetical protein
MHFEAAAQYRLSQEDLEKSRYGEEIARLRVAEACAKKGLDTGKRGVADAVIADLRVGPILFKVNEANGRTYKLLSSPLWTGQYEIMTLSTSRLFHLHRNWRQLSGSGWSSSLRLPRWLIRSPG